MHPRPASAPAAIVMTAARDVRGSILIEAIVTALIIAIVGLGVMEMLNRSTQLSGAQRSQAVAGDLAQAEQDTVRSLDLATLSNLRRGPISKTVGDAEYEITSRADWVNDTTGDANCTTAASDADYLKLQTTVTYTGIGSRKPVQLHTLIAPPVRSFGVDQGSLAMQVTNHLPPPNNGVSGLTLTLSGPSTTLADTSNANGCVLWGYLPAGNGYTISGSRAGWVQPDGSTTVGGATSVVGDKTSNVTYLYDAGGWIRTRFTTKRPGAEVSSTNPLWASVEHGGGGGVRRSFQIPGASDTLDTELLFPFTTAYTVYADTCALAGAPAAGQTATPAPVVTPGGRTTTSDLAIPALDVRVQRDGVAVSGANIHVQSQCGTAYNRLSTATNGQIDDPGFPYGTLQMVCVSKGGRSNRRLNVANTDFDGTTLTLDIGTSPAATSSGATAGTCPT